MTLIIETGQGLPGAESYASAADLVMYAGKFGVVVPGDVPAQEALLRRAALAMDGMTWKGRKTSSEQALSWPRREVLLDHEIKPSNYLPARIQYGQMALAAEIHQDDINPVEKRKGAVLLDRVEGAVSGSMRRSPPPAIGCCRRRRTDPAQRNLLITYRSAGCLL